VEKGPRTSRLARPIERRDHLSTWQKREGRALRLPRRKSTDSKAAADTTSKLLRLVSSCAGVLVLINDTSHNKMHFTKTTYERFAHKRKKDKKA
jgi:hypothetical protein